MFFMSRRMYFECIAMWENVSVSFIHTPSSYLFVTQISYKVQKMLTAFLFRFFAPFFVSSARKCVASLSGWLFCVCVCVYIVQSVCFIYLFFFAFCTQKQVNHTRKIHTRETTTKKFEFEKKHVRTISPPWMSLYSLTDSKFLIWFLIQIISKKCDNEHDVMSSVWCSNLMLRPKLCGCACSVVFSFCSLFFGSHFLVLFRRRR